MLKIFVRFLTSMILIASLYLFYVNSSFTSLQQLNKKEIVSVKLQNLPEIILPLKEDLIGYQYELLKSFLGSIGKNKIKLGFINNDIEIFYQTESCNKCVVINKQDLLLISNSHDEKDNAIEFSNIYKNVRISDEINKNIK